MTVTCQIRFIIFKEYFGKTLNVLVIRLQRTWFELAFFFHLCKKSHNFAPVFVTAPCLMEHPVSIHCGNFFCEPMLLSWRTSSPLSTSSF